jgi:hypothetical protein
MPASTIAIEDDAVLARERMALLHRVAGCALFRRSQRLRDFLLYVGREAVERGRSELHEQEIGEAVFGRARDYDTSVDNIVRVTATELRKRLELYFNSEGADETLVAEIPRGTYLPTFRRRVHQSLATDSQEAAPEMPSRHAVAEAHETPAASPARGDRAVGKPWMWQVLVLLLVAAVVWLARDVSRLQLALSPWKSGSALRALWSPFFSRGSVTDVVLADTSFALAEDITGRAVPLGDYLNSSYPVLANDPPLSAGQRTDLQLILSRNNGSFGDFQVAHQLLNLNPASPLVQVHFARDYTADSLNRSNVILIGSRKSNPWVDLFEGQMNFVLRYDPATHCSYVQNRHPRAGEQADYQASTESETGDGYSVISLLPGVSTGRQALILEGTSSEATNSAGDFVTREASLATLRARMGGSLPSSFEVLLRTTHLRGTPLRWSIVAVRVDAN